MPRNKGVKMSKISDIELINKNEDEFFEETEYDCMCLCKNHLGWVCTYSIRNTPEYFEGVGDTRNEARLNVMHLIRQKTRYSRWLKTQK